MIEYMPKCYDKVRKMSYARRCRIAAKLIKKRVSDYTKEDALLIEYMLLTGEIYASGN